MRKTEYAALERRPGGRIIGEADIAPRPQAIVKAFRYFEKAYTQKHGARAMKAFHKTHTFSFTTGPDGDLVPRVRELTREEIAYRARCAAPPRPGARIREHAAYLKRLQSTW